MDIELYKRRLLGLQSALTATLGHDESVLRTSPSDLPADAGDASIADEAAAEGAGEAERDAALLARIDEALLRIEHGTYGRCVVDGGPIETARLDAEPWAEYCIRHQRLTERASAPKPTM